MPASGAVCLLSKAPVPRLARTCVRELMTSISCSVTLWTTSLRFCSSPSGHCTNLVAGPADMHAQLQCCCHASHAKHLPQLQIHPIETEAQQADRRLLCAACGRHSG